MKARHRRFAWIGAGIAALALAVGLVLNAFQSNLVFFFSPTQVLAKEAPVGRPFRIGGLVEEGSLKRESGSLAIRFVVTDTVQKVPVAYTGLLPDLFKEGKGVVGDPQVAFTEAALLVAERALQQLGDDLLAQRFERQHRGARQQRRDDLERRVLRRRADQHDGPVLDVRQESILLRLVETMNLVDEEDRLLARIG